ncbi:Ig-like domain-containing protein [Pseudomonas wadenswilerensis]
MVQYRHLLEFTRQAEQALLDYLKLVNGLPADLTEDDLRLIREDAAGKIAQFTGFSIRDILETAEQISANGLVVSVRQMDHLVRVRMACETLQLGTAAALELGALRSNSPREVYRSAAEGALSSLTALLEEQAVPSPGELGQSEASWIVVDTQRLVARSDEKARCLLTVKNFLGQPLANVTVTWETSLSRLDAPSSETTDANGQVWVYLQAGEEMGTAQVTARFGLDRQILAPLIHIDCDILSLEIRDLVREPDEALAGNLQVIEYRLQVVDSALNPGRDQVVQWSSDLGSFERTQTRTDDAGFASARLRSLSSGVATVTAELPVNGEQESFDPVTFLEQQYFQYVRFSGPLAAGQPALATCRVVNLDGSPQRTVTVLWSADFGGFVEDPARSISNNDGVAVINYLSTEPGEVTLTINAKFNHKDLQPLSTAPATIHELPTLHEMEPHEQYYVIQQGRPARFLVHLVPEAAGYPVTWWAGERQLGTTYTSSNGRTEYQCYFTADEMGEQVITVRTLREGDEFDFKVFVSRAHDRLELQVPEDNPRLLGLDDGRGFVIDRGASGDLSIHARRDDGAGDDGARISLQLAQGADPATLNLVFDPPLGEIIQCDEDGVAHLHVDASAATFLPGSDPYNNEVALTVTSNLGITTTVTGRLRDFVDLAASPMKTVEDGGQIVGICGYLQRLDGSPLQFQAGSARLRASPSADEDGGSLTDLFSDSTGRTCFMFEQVLFAPTEMGSCTFFATGGLGKRLHFTSGNTRTFSAGERLSELSLTLEVPEEGFLVEDGTLFLDTHQQGELRVIVRNAGMPVSGIGYYRRSFNSGGAVAALSDVFSDSEGAILFAVDTRDVTLTDDGLNNDYSLPGGIGGLTAPLLISLREFVLASATAAFRGSGPGIYCSYSVNFYPPPGEGMGASSQFSGKVFMNGIGQEFIKTTSGSGVNVSGRIDAGEWDIPGTLWVDMKKSKRFMVSGTTSFPIADETTQPEQGPGDAS